VRPADSTILGKAQHLVFTIEQLTKITIGRLNLQGKNILLFLEAVKVGEN
jgi:hypothetical protein